MDVIFSSFIDIFGLFSKIGLAVADIGSGMFLMMFEKFALEVWSGRELPAYTLEGAEADWSHQWNQDPFISEDEAEREAERILDEENDPNIYE